MRISLLVGAAALLLPASVAAQDGPPPRPGRLFVSPAGEVFRGDGGPPLQTWFTRADADQDGAITITELRADFARAFAGFDSDGDGEIEPDEVARYETETFPEMGRFGVRGGGAGFRPAMRQGRLARGPRNGGGTRRRVEGGHWAMMAGAARFGLLPISHPIMTPMSISTAALPATNMTPPPAAASTNSI